MQRTIKIKLGTNKVLLHTLKVASEIRQKITDEGLKIKTYNKVELHKQTYKKLRKEYPDIPSALLQTIRDVACESLKQTKLKKKINVKEYGSLRLDKRLLRVDLVHKNISVSSMEGRQKISFEGNKQLNKFVGWSAVAGTLVYRNNMLFLNVVVEKQTPHKNITEKDDVLGVDRGVNNIVVASNNQFFNSKKLKNIKGKYQHNKRVLQSKGTRSARRKLCKLRGRERRFVSDVNHCLSKAIAEGGFNVFALEKLMIRKHKKNGRCFNRLLGSWSYAEFECFLRYKCEERGKLVLSVPPAYTSQMCCVCGHIEKSNRKGCVFKCKCCGFELHSDLNASRNIACLGKSELSRLFVNQPNVAPEEVCERVVTSQLIH